jgi:hypothetical protein
VAEEEKAPPVTERAASAWKEAYNAAEDRVRHQTE